MPTVSRIDHKHPRGPKALTKFQIDQQADENMVDELVVQEACRRQRHEQHWLHEATIEYWVDDEEAREGYAVVTMRAGHGGPRRSPVIWKLKVWLHDRRIVKGRITPPKRLGRRLAMAS